MITFLKDQFDFVRKNYHHSEDGFTTAELVGNAALGVAALAGIYALMNEQIFPNLISFIKEQLGI